VDNDNDVCIGANAVGGKCSDDKQVTVYFFGPFQDRSNGFSVSLAAEKANAANIPTVTLPGGTVKVTVVAVDQTVTVSNASQLVFLNSDGSASGLNPAAFTNPTGAGITFQSYDVSTATASTGGSGGNTGIVKAGQSTNFSFSPTVVTGQTLGSGTLNLACSNNVLVQGGAATTLDALHITCSVSPNQVTGGAQATVLITTSGAVFANAQPLQQQNSNPAAPLYAVWMGFLSLPLAGMVFMTEKRSKRTKVLLAIAFLVLLVGTQVACGGGGIGGAAPKLTTAGTPVGTYTIQVIGTQGTSATPITTDNFTITVQ
jgi:hypothetical protein